MLAILVMLAALRVTAGGSAPPISCVVRRGLGAARSGRESRLADRTGKCESRCCPRGALLIVPAQRVRRAGHCPAMGGTLRPRVQRRASPQRHSLCHARAASCRPRSLRIDGASCALRGGTRAQPAALDWCDPKLEAGHRRHPPTGTTKSITTGAFAMSRPGSVMPAKIVAY